MGQTTAGSASVASGQGAPRHMTVHSIEACNCRPGCNCQFTGFPDFGGCEASVLELAQTPIRDAVPRAGKAVQIVYPNGGFFWNVGNVAAAGTMSCDFGLIRFRHPGGFASYAT